MLFFLRAHCVCSMDGSLNVESLLMGREFIVEDRERVNEVRRCAGLSVLVLAVSARTSAKWDLIRVVKEESSVANCSVCWVVCRSYVEVRIGLGLLFVVLRASEVVTSRLWSNLRRLSCSMVLGAIFVSGTFSSSATEVATVDVEWSEPASDARRRRMSLSPLDDVGE
jgi:hypothetical protein